MCHLCIDRGSLEFNSLRSFLFNNICAVCEEYLTSSERHVCRFCLGQLPKKPLSKVQPWGLLQLYFSYSFPLREMLLAWKYRGAKLSPVFRHLFRVAWEEFFCQEILNIDLIMPVPLHPNRSKLRGFNQSLVLAEVLAPVLKVEIDTSSLLRKKDTKQQSLCTTREQKARNIKGAFALDKTRAAWLEGKTILLIDDITTSGNTLNECGIVLSRYTSAPLKAIALAG